MIQMCSWADNTSGSPCSVYRDYHPTIRIWQRAHQRYNKPGEFNTLHEVWTQCIEMWWSRCSKTRPVATLISIHCIYCRYSDTKSKCIKRNCDCNNSLIIHSPYITQQLLHTLYSTKCLHNFIVTRVSGPFLFVRNCRSMSNSKKINTLLDYYKPSSKRFRGDEMVLPTFPLRRIQLLFLWTF